MAPTTVTDMYYVTKYALTEGIWIVKPEHTQESDGYLYVSASRSSLGIQVKKTDWFKTPEEAFLRVRQLQEKKLRNLERSIHNLKQRDTQYMKAWGPK